MSLQSLWLHDCEVSDETALRGLYQQVLNAWNQRDAAAYAALFAENACVVGFDGSQMNGRAAVEAEIGQIFRDHQTAAYIGKVREVRLLSPGVAMLSAVVGMVPPGQSDLNPAANAIQSLVASKTNGAWRVTLFQNTPAQFHGRPQLVKELTDELRQELKRVTS